MVKTEAYYINEIKNRSRKLGLGFMSMSMRVHI